MQLILCYTFVEMNEEGQQLCLLRARLLRLDKRDVICYCANGKARRKVGHCSTFANLNSNPRKRRVIVA
jgi:hypothetical protein